MVNRKIVLASKSPRRRELLSTFISNFEIIADNSQEVIEPDITPEEAVKKLALQKAENVAAKADGDAVIIAADTIVFIDGEIFLNDYSSRKKAEY